MRLVFVAGALLMLAAVFGGGGAQAQSLQCTQLNDRLDRDACANREMDDIRDRVRYWRRAAGQSAEDYGYFENERARCHGSAECIARTYQIEISELQVKIEPARRLPEYRQPAALELEGGPTDLSRLMDAIIMDDSRHWAWNSYDRGSVRNVRAVDQGTGVIIVYADYTYNGGAPGWVQAQIVGDRVRCMEYHDYQGRCRPWGAQSYAYGDAASFAFQTIAGAAVQALMTPH